MKREKEPKKHSGNQTMKSVKFFFLLFGLFFLAGLLKAQDMERWLLVRPGKNSQIVREPMAGDPPKGTVVSFSYEGFPGYLDKLCRDYAADLASETETRTERAGPSFSEVSQIQETLLLAALEASAAEVLRIASMPASLSENLEK